MRLLRPLRLAAAALAATLAVTLAGCLDESEHPVSAADPAQEDPRLWGAWLNLQEDGFTIVHVQATEKHGLHIIAIDHGVEGIGGEPDVYEAFASRLPVGDYLNVEVTGDEAGYLIGKYSFDGKDALSVAFPAEAALKAAIAGGALPGKITDENGVLDLRITASSEQWQAFLAKPPADFFNEPIQFQRVGPSYVSE
ncbi:MAG TPA: hypothetical protein PLR41_12210 [Alphaproteobacteria bacterium]|nr:hypothetical protein [Alphaproteobacteria bacterium]